MSKLLSTADLAEMFNVTRQTIHNWERQGLIAGIRVHKRGKVFYDPAQIKELLKTPAKGQ
jgi:DNA-binding transcriptional MerR regulator